MDSKRTKIMSSVQFETVGEERILPKLEGLLPEEATEAFVSMDTVEIVLLFCLCVTILGCFYGRICRREGNRQKNECHKD